MNSLYSGSSVNVDLSSAASLRFSRHVVGSSFLLKNSGSPTAARSSEAYSFQKSALVSAAVALSAFALASLSHLSRSPNRLTTQTAKPMLLRMNSTRKTTRMVLGLLLGCLERRAMTDLTGGLHRATGWDCL